MLLTAFWAFGLFLPRSLFLRQWRWFQEVQTGRTPSPGAGLTKRESRE
jgi:hypothetical protein